MKYLKNVWQTWTLQTITADTARSSWKRPLCVTGGLFVASITIGGLLDLFLYRTPDLIDQLGPLLFVLAHTGPALLLFPVLCFMLAGVLRLLAWVVGKKVDFYHAVTVVALAVSVPIVVGTLYNVLFSLELVTWVVTTTQWIWYLSLAWALIASVRALARP